MDELTDEQIQELQEKAARTDELEQSLKEKESELEKLSQKDFNFRKFEQSKKEEQQEMLKDFSEKERIMITQMSLLQSQFNESEQSKMNEAKDSVFNSLGLDDELKQRLEDSVKHSIAYIGEPKTTTELKERYMRAWGIIKNEEESKINPLSSFAPITGSHIVEGQKKDRFTDTQHGKALFEQKFSKELEKVKRINPNII